MSDKILLSLIMSAYFLNAFQLNDKRLVKWKMYQNDNLL